MTSEDVSGWEAGDWLASASLGVKVINSSHVVIRNSDISNVSGGIYVDADMVIAQGNVMTNVSGDGMHGHGDDLYFVNNLLRNRYDVDGRSADGFQSWASGTNGSARHRVHLSGNMIISNADSANPFPGQFTGINCNDGPYAEWVIENNVIISDDTEGIILYGASDTRVVNNTVLSTSDNVSATIAIFQGKDESVVSNSFIRNNITNSVLADDGVSVDHNLLLTATAQYNSHFSSFDDFDLSLLPESSAVDTGSEVTCSDYDISGIVRPQGNGIDLGAYELVP
jgi:parallel beta-helix repeat protein